MNIFLRGLSTFFLILMPAHAYAFHCTVTSTPVAFGNYDVFSASPLDTTGTITVNCNNPENHPLQVKVSINSGSVQEFNPRQMRHSGGTDRMNYYLFIDPSKTTIWGDGTDGTSSLTSTIVKTSPLNATIYGRVPARQNLRAGTYNDNLVVTVIW